MKKRWVCSAIATSITLISITSGSVLAGVISPPIVNPSNLHTYYLLDASDWTVAETEAVGLGGHLTTIRSQVENDWVYGTFGQDRNLWIGLYQPSGSPEPDGGWVWINGEPVQYLNWDVPEPNNAGDENFVTIWGNLEDIAGDPEYRHAGRWNDLSDGVFPIFHVPFGVVEVVPEPSTLTLCSLFGLAGLGYGWWRKRRQ